MTPPESWHVARTLRALELLAFSPLSAPRLAAAMRADPRTVRRLLGRLEEEEYVTRSRDARRVYEPTMRIVALAGQIVQNSRVARSARPYVTLLHERTREAAHLAVTSYQSVLCVAHKASELDDARPRLRELVPAHCTAGGKVLLAWRERWRESVLSAPLERWTDRTVVDPRALRHELEVVRTEGFASEDGELQDHVRAVAAPVVVGEDVLAALTASGRGLDIDAVTRHVVAVAHQLSESLGHAAE
jgi:DNA-binding IclR family transcriptional regulator